MDKIGFFGGCFNPPTIAHLNLAKIAIDNFGLDKIYFIPMNDFYLKPDLESSVHRLNMLKLLTKDEDKLEVDDFELKLNKRLFAIDAFSIIDEKYNCEKYFIMGSDNYIKMKSWKESDKLDKYNYIILDRKNEIASKNNIMFVSNNEFSDISSSYVRNLISKNGDVERYLNKDVYQYIKSNSLYL